MERIFKDQFGFLTIVQNNSTTDYLACALLQARNIKATQPNQKYAVLIDSQTKTLITQEHHEVFDYIIDLKIDDSLSDEWKLRNEWQIFWSTPFKETIKIESDLLFPRSILHWLSALRNKDFCFSLNCKNYLGEKIIDTNYRKIFYINDLPNIYTGMFYFRFTQKTADFFRTVRAIYKNWEQIRSYLKFADKNPTTDLVFALALKIYGDDVGTIPTLDFFNFVHMKPLINDWSESRSWVEYVNIEQDESVLRINNTNQYFPVHYYDKNYFTK